MTAPTRFVGSARTTTLRRLRSCCLVRRAPHENLRSESCTVSSQHQEPSPAGLRRGTQNACPWVFADACQCPRGSGLARCVSYHSKVQPGPRLRLPNRGHTNRHTILPYCRACRRRPTDSASCRRRGTGTGRSLAVGRVLVVPRGTVEAVKSQLVGTRAAGVFH